MQRDIIRAYEEKRHVTPFRTIVTNTLSVRLLSAKKGENQGSQTVLRRD